MSRIPDDDGIECGSGRPSKLDLGPQEPRDELGTGFVLVFPPPPDVDMALEDLDIGRPQG